MRGDLDALQLEVRGALRRQRRQHGAFGVDAGTVASVVATDDLGDEGAIGSEVVEVTGAAQQQGLLDGALEVAVGASSSKMVTARRAGDSTSNGTTSFSKMPSSASRRRLVRGVSFCDGGRGSDSMR